MTSKSLSFKMGRKFYVGLRVNYNGTSIKRSAKGTGEIGSLYRGSFQYITLLLNLVPRVH